MRKNYTRSSLIIGTALFASVLSGTVRGQAPAQSLAALDKLEQEKGRHFLIGLKNSQLIQPDTTFFYSNDLTQFLQNQDNLPSADSLKTFNDRYGDFDSGVMRTSYDEPLSYRFEVEKGGSIPFAFNEMALSHHVAKTAGQDSIVSVPDLTDLSRNHNPDHIVLINGPDDLKNYEAGFNTFSRILNRWLEDDKLTVIGNNENGFMLEDIGPVLEQVRQNHDKVLFVVNAHGMRCADGHLRVGGQDLEAVLDTIAAYDFDIADTYVNSCYGGVAPEFGFEAVLPQDSYLLSSTSANHVFSRSVGHGVARDIVQNMQRDGTVNIAQTILSRHIGLEEREAENKYTTPPRLAISGYGEIANPELLLAAMIGHAYSDEVKNTLYDRTKDETRLNRNEFDKVMELVSNAEDITQISPKDIPVAMGLATAVYYNFTR